VSVVGVSGSGKTTVARRLAARLGVPHVELDALYHGPDWSPAPDDLFLARVDRATASGGWVVDGNYSVVRPLVWARANTVVWVDPPRWRVTAQITGRTVRRTLTREELWNGNREPITGIVRWDPERSVVRWSWTTFRHNRERYRRAMAESSPGGPTFVRLGSRREMASFVDRATPAPGAPASPGRHA
jgi:adenylate kinase family enzyme